MAKYASEVIKQAKSWLGKNEADGSFKTVIDTYNSHKPHPRGYAMTYTAPWCATFVSAVAIKLGYTDIIPVECSCTRMIELFQKLDAWAESDSRTPDPGDILFYDWNDTGKGDNTGDPEHVGVVEKVENGQITVIEGNYKNAVSRRTLAVNSKNIRGYGVPKYDTKTAQKTVAEIAKEVIAGKWGNGADRKNKLTAAGYDYDQVQAEVNAQISGKKPAAPAKTVEQIAKEVIAGKWGNGAQRKSKLTAAGYDYAAVQRLVNQLLKK